MKKRRNTARNTITSIAQQKYLFFLFLLLLFVAAFMIRLWPLPTSCGWDECSYLQNAEVLFGLKHNNYDELFYRPLLLSLFFGVGFMLWHDLFTAAIITALLGAIGALLFYFIGKELFDTKTGIIAAVLASFLPNMVLSGHTLLADIPGVTFLSFSFYFFIRYYKSKKSLYAYLSGIFVGLTILTRYAALVDFIVLFTVFSTFLIMTNRKHLLRYLFSKKLIASAIIVLLSYVLAAFTLDGFDAIALFERAAYAVSGWDSPILFYISIIPTYFSLPVFIGLASLITYWFVTITRPKNQHTKITMPLRDLLLIIWFFSLLLFMCFTPHKEDRYLLLPLAIPTILLASRGFSIILHWINSVNKVMVKGTLVGVCIGIILFACIPSFVNLTHPFIQVTTPEEKVIIHAIEEKGYPTDTVIYTNYLFPLYAYYSQFPIYTTYQSEQRFFTDYNTFTKPGFFVYYKNSGMAPGLAWADHQPTLTRFMETEHIVVYRFDLSQNMQQP